MMTTPRRLAFRAVMTLALCIAVLPAQAAEKKQSNPFQGFSSSNGKPVNVRSDSLQVHQQEQRAVFTGHVVATQGASVLRANELTVFYENTAANGNQNNTGETAQSSGTKQNKATSPGQANSIKRLIAVGNVVVASEDQKATGDRGEFDMAKDTATLTGREVVMVQNGNVLRGTRLEVNLKTGLSSVKGGDGGVEGMFIQEPAK